MNPLRLDRFKECGKSLEPVRIRVYPEKGKSTLYALALVFPMKKDMLAYANVPVRFSAICQEITVRTYRPYGQWTRPVFAEVLFYRNRLGTRQIAHEFFHASLAFGRRVDVDFSDLSVRPNEVHVSETEERLAYAHDSMVSQFVDRAWKLGLIRK